MTISFEIPQVIEQQIRTNGHDLNDRAREAFLVEMYRQHAISHRELGEALGLEQYETDGLLKRYDVGLGVTLAEMRAEAEEILDGCIADDILEVKLLQEHLHDGIGQLVYDRTGRRPMILPIVVEV